MIEMKHEQSELCPKCGLRREYALENHRNGEPYALNLLLSCSECWDWTSEQIMKSMVTSPVDTALVGIETTVRDTNLGVAMVIFTPKMRNSIKAVIEALYEDGIEAGREMERTHQT